MNNYPEFITETNEVKRFEERLSDILNGMLRTGHSYANDLSSKIRLYIQLAEDHYGLDFLFEIGGYIAEVHTLNELGVQVTYENADGEQSTEKVEFDVSVERQQELQGYVRDDLANKLIPLFVNTNMVLPNEIWATVDVEVGNPKIRLGYNILSDMPTVDERIEEWKQQIITPLLAPVQLSDYPIESIYK